MLLSRQVILKTDGRIVVKNAATAFAKHHLVAMPQILKELRAKYNLTSRAASLQDFGDGPAVPFFSDALVGGVGWLFQRSHQGLAFRQQLFELFLIYGGALAGLVLFGLDLLLFFLQGCFRLLHIDVQRLGFGHEVQNPVLAFTDRLFAKAELLLEGAVLLVGLRAQHLIPELGDFLGLDFSVVFQAFAFLLIPDQGGTIGF